MRVAVSGAGGFIASHLVNRLVDEGYEVRAVDIKPLHEWSQPNLNAHNYAGWDCSDPTTAMAACHEAEWVFNLAADMGGMGFIESHRALCAEDVRTTLTMIQVARDAEVGRYFYASSACIYPADAQETPEVVPLAESCAIPAEPEAGYGWAKLYGELLARYFWEDYGLETRTARFHNIYGTHTAYEGGREKAPAAVCRKVAHAARSGDTTVEVWGDGEQTRSFCWVDDCVEGILRLMESDVREPLNIGSDELISINALYEMVAEHAGIKIDLAHDLDAPQGVRGRNSDNTLIRERLGWAPGTPLAVGMGQLFDWVSGEMA